MSNKEFPTGYPVGIKHYSNVTSREYPKVCVNLQTDVR